MMVFSSSISDNKAMRFSQCLSIAIVLSLAATAFAQRVAAPPAAPAKPPPTLVPAGQAVRLLHIEAADFFRAKPKELSLEERIAAARNATAGAELACDFAQRRNLTARSDDVARVILRRLNPDNAAIDSYVRWQMLSFGPKFEGVIDPKDMRNVLAMLPPFTAQPQYAPPAVPEPQGPPASMTIVTQKTIVIGQKPVPGTNGSRPKLAVVTSGVSMGSGGGAPPPAPVDVDAVMAEIRAKRGKMAETNGWVVRFRDALLPLLPEENGVRITAMLQDVGDRLGAGDPSWEDAVSRLMAVCEALPKPGATTAPTTQPAGLSMDLRRALAEQAKALGKISTPVVDGLKEKGNGEVGLEGFYVQFPPEQLNRMLLLLAGEAVPALPAAPVAIPPRDAPQTAEPTTAPVE